MMKFYLSEAVSSRDISFGIASPADQETTEHTFPQQRCSWNLPGTTPAMATG